MYLQKIIKNLKQEERDALFYAFEQSISYIVIYKPGLFIGVNVTETNNVKIKTIDGVWSTGDIHDQTRSPTNS